MQMHMSDSIADQHGYVNNAGRFRSELHQHAWCTRKKHSPSTCSDTLSFDYGKSVKPDESVDQELFMFTKDEDGSLLTADANLDSGELDTTGRTPHPNAPAILGSSLLDSNSLGKSVSSQSYLSEDFYQFDFIPYSTGGTGSNPSKSLSNPVHLENPERETRWYFKYFLGKFHQLYCGYVSERDPFLLAVAKTDVQSYGVSQYRAILWRKTGSQKLCISHNPTNSLTAKKVLNFFDLHRVEKGPKEVLNFEVQKDALTLEEQEGSVNFKFGVIYCVEGQTSDEQMYNNEHGSEEFNQFIDLLGDRIHLKSWDRFKGGLDTKSNTTGIDSVYTVYEGHEIMFHVSTLLPFSTENKQQIERKRHVGNDIVNIVFVDGVAPDAHPSWMPSMMKTHFTHIFAIVTYCKETSTYRLNVFAEESVPIFGPSLPSPPEFTNPQEFREFLLVKLINGEKAAFHSPVFAQKRERTFEMLLHVICNANLNDSSSNAICRRAFSDVIVDSLNGITTGKEQNRNDAYIRFGQMLKLNTIIRGDAPTSCITSGQSKKHPWQPKLFHTSFQCDIICGDVWGGNLIVSCDSGTFLLREHDPPVPIIERTVEVKQLEVIEQNEMLVLRYDKGREARIGVVQLADIDSGQTIDRNQLKKLSLEKTKGCHVFALSKSIIQPLRIAVVVHRRILIYQWRLITGRSLSSWNQFAQSYTPDSFQLIRELPILEPVQTLCFIEGIPGGRLCVGHRHQFDLIDERTRETVQLFHSEGSRNQVISAHEVWDEDEPELLLCFTRTCHFQKLCNVHMVSQSNKRMHPLHSSSSDNSTAVPTISQRSSTETSFSSTSVPSTGFCTGSSITSVSTPITISPSPELISGSPSLIPSPTDEKQRISEFDFTWNFEPKKVVVTHPYIFAFTSTSIEIRLVNNGSLVHTMLIPECRLISSKGGLFFSSTSESLDINSTLPSTNSSNKTWNESSMVTKKPVPLSNVSEGSSEKDSEDNSRREEVEQQPEVSNSKSNKRSPNSNQLSSSNSVASLALFLSNSPPVNMSESSTPPVKTRYIYRILFNAVPNNSTAQNTSQVEQTNQRKTRII